MFQLVGIGNQDLLNNFGTYKPERVLQSYGPHGHKGMSFLSFKKSAEGFANAERLSKDLESQGLGRNAWSNDARLLFSNGKRLLYGYLAAAEDRHFLRCSIGMYHINCIVSLYRNNLLPFWFFSLVFSALSGFLCFFHIVCSMFF